MLIKIQFKDSLLRAYKIGLFVMSSRCTVAGEKEEVGF